MPIWQLVHLIVTHLELVRQKLPLWQILGITLKPRKFLLPIIPNVLFDNYLQALTGAELKILLVILRQTNGWIDKRTGTRKKRDCLSYGQFIAKTGLSRRVVTDAIQKLVDKQLINVNCQSGKSMHLSYERRGNPVLYYSSDMCTFQPRLVHFPTQTCAKSAHNKTNHITKLTIQN